MLSKALLFLLCCAFHICRKYLRIIVNCLWIWWCVFFYSARIILLPKWLKNSKVHLVECSTVFALSYIMILNASVFSSVEDFSGPLSSTLQVLLDLAAIYAIQH